MTTKINVQVCVHSTRMFAVLESRENPSLWTQAPRNLQLVPRLYCNWMILNMHILLYREATISTQRIPIAVHIIETQHRLSRLRFFEMDQYHEFVLTFAMTREVESMICSSSRSPCAMVFSSRSSLFWHRYFP